METYSPLIFAYSRRHRLQDADASDLVQEVLSAVAAASERFAYDPALGTFRGWLLAIARNRLRRHLRRGLRHASGKGGTAHLALLAKQPDVAHDPYDREDQDRLFSRAAGRIRGDFQASTWEAFWKTAVEGQPAEAVARDLGISIGAVYIARSRVLARLREAIAGIGGDAPPGRAGLPSWCRGREGPA